MLVLGLIVIFGLLFLGVPLFLAFTCGGTLLNSLYAGAPLSNVAHMMFQALDSYVLMAIPFFILAGMIMTHSGLSELLVDFIDSWIGHLPGGIAIVLVVSTMLFGAMTGSGTAAVAAIGLVIVPRMLELGYNKTFALGLIAATAQLGVLIPPSIPMILFGALTETPVADLFMAGLLPGIIIGILLILVSVFICKRNGWGMHPPCSWQERRDAFVKAIPVLILPVIVLGGIYGGIFTATEASFICTLYALILAIIYRGIKIPDLINISASTLRTAGMLFLLVMSVIIFGKVMSYARIPHMLTEFVAGAGLSLSLFLLAIVMFYITVGFFAEVIIITYVTVPILFAVMTSMGVHPYQYAVIMTSAIIVASLTPPVGVNLYLASGFFKEPLENVIKGALPFLAVEVVCLFLFAYFPFFSTWLPSLMSH